MQLRFLYFLRGRHLCCPEAQSWCCAWCLCRPFSIAGSVLRVSESVAGVLRRCRNKRSRSSTR